MSSIQLWNNKKSEFLYLSFNQDNCCFAGGTAKGFRIFNTEPFRETFRRENFIDTEDEDKQYTKSAGKPSGIGIVEMLHRCNIVALVGGGENPRWPKNKVIIWDDRQESIIAELSFRQQVKAVKLRRDIIIVICEIRVYVYRFRDLHLIDHVETVLNPYGLGAANMDDYRLVLVAPSTQQGKVSVVFYRSLNNIFNEAPARESITLITAHTNPIAALSITNDGSVVATASTKGTLIRLFDSNNGKQLYELRRGVDQAIIYSINFDKTKNWLVAVSETKTLHVWNVSQQPLQNKNNIPTNDILMNSAQSDTKNNESSLNDSQNDKVENQKSRFHFMRKVLPSYFQSQWSFANARVFGGRSLCAFNSTSDIITVISEYGTIEKFKLSKTDKGSLKSVSIASFTDLKKKDDVIREN